MTASQCLNCEAPLEAQDKYCFECGQSTHVHRLSLGHLLHEIVHFVTHADKGIIFLVQQLIVHPGKVAREYIAGRRKKYFSPLSFFLIVLGLFVFAFTTLRPMQGPERRSEQQLDSLRKLAPTRANIQRLVYAERSMKASTFMAKYSNVVNMVVTPLFALLFYLAYLRGTYNYTEHLVANLYASGMNALVLSLVVAPLTLLTQRGTGGYYLLLMCFLLWEALYRSFLYYGLFAKRGVKAYLYALLISLAASCGWVLLSTGGIRWYIMHGFAGR